MFPRRRVLLAATALLLAVPTAATAAPASTEDVFRKARTSGPVATTFTPAVLDTARKVSVMVQLEGDPVAVQETRAQRKFSSADRGRRKSVLRKAQDAISDDISAAGGRVLSHLQSAYNGMRVEIARGKVASLAKLPGVVAVHAITPRTLDNTVSVPFLGVPQVWQDTGYTGKAVKVGIIDTGIDYTHADFGGPGTTAAYTAAHEASTQPADPALFGPSAPRVKGGHDFVGDGYNASADAGSPALVPKPDPNPLDCNGHGSHVAGTAAGSGVTAAGDTYPGPYDAATPNQAFKVGPGVAPEADLYALRVFGCEGSTDVVTEAIDWAVDHQLDVINMSLGGVFGRASDPDAVAASNAVGAGIVVVTSGGNAGPNPYLADSPGAGEGVIAVSAVDSTPTFPGATLTLPSGSITAINANGAELPSSTFTVVRVTDDPATTTVNEALGCSVEAYTKAGITPDDGRTVIAVVDRGDCARAAKPIFGQQAGADAVVMVNNAAAYPPYEGPITSNPDDDKPYTVTIPFLGVPNTAGPALAAADGQTLTMAPTTLDNPGFRRYADFSSGGPANGDSGITPNVAAPGVAISSAGVGTGNGPAIISGTSMAAPHVAGVAALGVQAHPDWSAPDVAAAVLSTSDPDKVDGYGVTAGGGLVDAAQVVNTPAFVTGDSYSTTSGRAAEATLSYGFAEPRTSFVGTRRLTIHNAGAQALTFTLGQEASEASRPASVRLSRQQVTVPAGGKATVAVTLRVSATSVGSSLTEDGFGFHQVSGNVTVSSSAGMLRVPYLLVPRARANVTASLTGGRSGLSANSTDTTSTTPGATRPSSGARLTLANRGGALAAEAGVFTWGLTDPRDVDSAAGGSGWDLRAAGVQALDFPDGKVVAFAVNNHDRWSNAASQEFDISVDTNRDGKPDYLVVAIDSGYATTGSFNGEVAIFTINLATNAVVGSSFAPIAPTDSSTMIVPLEAADLGLTDDSGPFAWTVASSSVESDDVDEFDDWASYDPWAKAVSDGDYPTVPRNGRIRVPLTVDAAQVTVQKPKGVMVVVLDNKSGRREALLLRAH